MNPEHAALEADILPPGPQSDVGRRTFTTGPTERCRKVRDGTQVCCSRGGHLTTGSTEKCMKAGFKPRSVALEADILPPAPQSSV